METETERIQNEGYRRFVGVLEKTFEAVSWVDYVRGDLNLYPAGGPEYHREKRAADLLVLTARGTDLLISGLGLHCNYGAQLRRRLNWQAVSIADLYNIPPCDPRVQNAAEIMLNGILNSLEKQQAL